MPLDAIKTRLQVLEEDENGKRRPTVGQTLRNLIFFFKKRWLDSLFQRVKVKVGVHVSICNNYDY